MAHKKARSNLNEVLNYSEHFCMFTHITDSMTFVVKIQRVYIVLFMKKLRQKLVKEVKSFVQEKSLWKQEFCKAQGMLYSSPVNCPMLIMMVFSMELPIPLFKQCFWSATGIVSKVLCQKGNPIGHLELSLLFLLILTLSSQIVLNEGRRHSRQGAIVGCKMSFLFVYWMHYTFFTIDFYL